MALKLLVDTSVWLDLAKDYRQQPVIAALEDLVAAGEIELIVPQVLLDEFARNKERVAIDATRSLQSHFNLVRDAVNRFGEEREGRHSQIAERGGSRRDHEGRGGQGLDQPDREAIGVCRCVAGHRRG